jgi:hypothetical protein
MSSHSVAHFLISLFTTTRRADPILGDLAELAETRGESWFWFQVVQTSVALFWLRLSTAPLIVVSVVAIGLGLDSVIELEYWRFVVEPFGLYPQETLGMLLYYAMLAASSTLIGIVLVLVAPKRGLCACLLVGGIQLCSALIHQFARFGGGGLSDGRLASALLWVTFVGLFLVTSPLVGGGIAGRRLRAQDR